MPVTKDQAQMLATLAVACRPHGAPHWDAAGVVAAIAKVHHVGLADVMMAVIRAAADRDAKTPGVIAATTSIHWSERVTERAPRFPARAGIDECRTHPGEHADGCRACAADALAGDPTPATRPLQSAPPPASYLDARRALSKQPPEQGA
jgi:hypothetical protein